MDDEAMVHFLEPLRAWSLISLFGPLNPILPGAEVPSGWVVSCNCWLQVTSVIFQDFLTNSPSFESKESIGNIAELYGSSETVEEKI